jgi:serine protease Do
VLGYDKTNDVAVITFTTDILGEERTFTPITLMDQEYEDLVTVGQTALVLGCPLSLENYNHLSVGTVSQVEEKRIYTDATVNPGNSGGGMFNMEGRLIGLINSKTVWTTQTEDGITSQLPVEGMGYAITLDVVKNCITEIEENGGEITRHVFGMYVTMVNSLLGDQNYLDYKQYLPEGEGQYAYVVIKSFLEGSVAEAQGLRVGDVILKFNGETVKVNNDISNLLTLVSPNEDVILTIYRSSEEKVMDVTITWGK